MRRFLFVLLLCLAAKWAIGSFHSVKLSDFRAFYTAGELARDNPSGLYEVSVQQRTQAHDLNFMPFVYPPIVAALFIPSSHLSREQAFYAMIPFHLAVLGLSLYFLCQTFQLQGMPRRFFILGALSFMPVYGTLAQGQVSFVGLLLISLALRYKSGIPIGLMAYKPTLSPFLILWLVFQRDWRALKQAVLTSVILAILSILWIGPAQIPDYLDMLSQFSSGAFSTASTENGITLRSALLHFNLPTWLMVFGFLLAAFILRQSGFWGALTLSVVLAPHGHLHDLVLLIPVFAYAVSQVELSTVNMGLLTLALQLPVVLFQIHPYCVPLSILISMGNNVLGRAIRKRQDVFTIEKSGGLLTVSLRQ